MGRPTRINKSDCDVEALRVEDLVDSNPPLHLSESSRVLVERCNSLAPLFVRMTRLSSLLGDILRCQYAPGSPKNSLEKVQSFEDELNRWYSELDPWLKIDLSTPVSHDSHVTTLHKHVLHIYFQ
jgi:hypothetical protein